MKIMLATLVLNEMEWLEKLYEQHKDWPGLTSWCFVEAADRPYVSANPGAVGHDGLSTDGTGDFLRDLARRDPRVVYIPHGLCGAFPGGGVDTSQGKCEARNRYMEVADEVRPDFLMVVDADEFYGRGVQGAVNETFAMYPAASFIFRQRHIWYPPRQQSASKLLFAYEVTGGYWKIPHIRGWRWEPDLRYRSNHNWLADNNGHNLPVRSSQVSVEFPYCVHMGFASTRRHEKNRYYVLRGEGRGDGRSMYVQCRAAWERWHHGARLPAGAAVRHYEGMIPEVFQ